MSELKLGGNYLPLYKRIVISLPVQLLGIQTPSLSDTGLPPVAGISIPCC